MTYSAEVTAQAESHPILGAEYFEARNVAERFLAVWQEEHAEKLAAEIIKPLIETIQERVNDAFRDHLIGDAEQNMQGTMRSMVEATVRALIGGEKWANVKYIETKYRDGQQVRKTLAKLYADPVKDGRIADLERQVAELTKSLECARR